MHALIRTSPKERPFLGTCVKCGKADLPMRAAREACRNTARLTESEALFQVFKQ